MNIQSINPATGEVLENFQEMSTSEIDGILEAAETTFREWRKRPFADRTKRMREAAPNLERRQGEVCADHGPRDGETDRPG